MCLFNSACTLLQMAVHVFDNNIMYNIWCLRTTIIHMQRGRRGLRSKYVDVLNPGGPNTSSSSIGGPPPPGPPLMGTVMPGPPQPFSGTFFVPQQPPGTYVQYTM